MSIGGINNIIHNLHSIGLMNDIIRCLDVVILLFNLIPIYYSIILGHIRIKNRRNLYEMLFIDPSYFCLFNLSLSMIKTICPLNSI